MFIPVDGEAHTHNHRNAVDELDARTEPCAQSEVGEVEAFQGNTSRVDEQEAVEEGEDLLQILDGEHGCRDTPFRIAVGKVRAEIEVFVSSDGVQAADEVSFTQGDIIGVARAKQGLDEAEVPAVFHDPAAPELGVVGVDIGKPSKVEVAPDSGEFCLET